ncbi:MAG: hypothetical protein IT374_12385 [Polyangiaceae bacterium]|nr:hypothetical protein [Polyangiaceae bacterium]
MAPRRALDFGARLCFFALAPLAIVKATALFPVWGALVGVTLAIVVFLLSERLSEVASSSRIVRLALGRELRIAAFYRAHPPKPFAYYALYPLLFPYWLYDRTARREAWLFKGYTAVGVVILVASFAGTYFHYFPPELGLREFLPLFGLSLAVEAVLVLWLLMPLATSVIQLHSEGRRRELFALLFVALASTATSAVRLLRRRDPVVSYATRERVVLRTHKERRLAREVQASALRAAWGALGHANTEADGDGKLLGPPLEQAHVILGSLYKPDEALAFDLWASSRRDPKLLILYTEGRSWRRPIWVAIGKDGREITDPKKLPKGAFRAMHLAYAE